jgi:hypothetical protein
MSAVVDSPGGAEVVRGVAFLPGWTATWTPSSGGSTTTLAVRSSGLVQAVDVPGGRGVVTWSYRAPGVVAGLVLTGLGVLVLVALVAGALFVRRARRPGDRASRLRPEPDPVPN